MEMRYHWMVFNAKLPLLHLPQLTHIVRICVQFNIYND